MWWEYEPLRSHFLSLLRIVMVKNLPISSILSFTYPCSSNFNFHCNLSDSKVEDHERLMSSLTCLYLSPSILDARGWLLSSWGLCIVKSFFLVLCNQFNLISFYPYKFIWKSKFPAKLKTFSWLMAHEKVYTNGMLQLRKSYKALSSDVGLLCMENGKMMNHFFLLSLLTLGLWHIDFPNQLTWTRFLLRVFVTWWSSHIRDWKAPLRQRSLANHLSRVYLGCLVEKK